jgi:hypothetical protein
MHFILLLLVNPTPCKPFSIHLVSNVTIVSPMTDFASLFVDTFAFQSFLLHCHPANVERSLTLSAIISFLVDYLTKPRHTTKSVIASFSFLKKLPLLQNLFVLVTASVLNQKAFYQITQQIVQLMLLLNYILIMLTPSLHPSSFQVAAIDCTLIPPHIETPQANPHYLPL